MTGDPQHRREGAGAARPVESRLVGPALIGLCAGGITYAAGAADLARWLLAGTTAVVLVPTVVTSASRLVRGALGVDVIAVLAMGAALLMEQWLAGAIVAVMLAGGASLEHFAVRRARRELRHLLERAPRQAHRRTGEHVVTIGVGEVVVGDQLVVKPGEVVPADGVLVSASAVLDESPLTGEAKPVEVHLGSNVRSGGTNAGAPLELRVTASAAESTYAGIIRLVASAEASKAPFVRFADRFAVVFLVVTLVLAAGTWLVSGDPLRALAVLVVATPCPLILAAPAAIVSGISCAARNGIIFKGGGALEALARGRILLVDKTGTVTAGRAQVVAVEGLGSASSDEITRLAASVEQMSAHPYAPAILAAAHARDLPMTFPTEVHEELGIGISGSVAGRRIAVGQLHWVAPAADRTPELRAIEQRTAVEGSAAVYVAIDGAIAGAILLQDPIRSEAPRALRALRGAGFRRIDMVTGDHPDVAELVADAIGIDRVYAERAPDEKVDVVRQLRREGVTVMLGDGINDAPGLALADVGVAMGARGASAASEAADVVITVDRLEGLVLATGIARRTGRIARQSVIAGMALSAGAMAIAAAGYLPPVAGALLQEVIDVLVILNALRALGLGRLGRRRPRGARVLAGELARAHQALRPRVGELSSVAAKLDLLAPAEARAELLRIRDMLEQELLPHEESEQQSAFPILGNLLRDEDPTGLLIQTHHEIRRLVRLYARLLDRLPPAGPGPADLRDLRRVLYGLGAVLALHFAQEDELYTVLDA